MPQPVVVLDFDGTMTDAEIEGKPFVDGYLDDLIALVDRPRAEVTAIVERTLAEILADPGAYPFRWGTDEVAPAVVDPYLRMATIANRVLDAAGAFTVAGERDRLLSRVLYRHNYQRTVDHPAFRPDAAELLRGLGQRPELEVYVVTNSAPDHVRAKILRLDREAGGGVAWLADRVRGNAGKFEIDRSWAGPGDLSVPGLGRPILRGRRKYHDILTGLCDGDFARLTVLGDIFELDLALPEAMGARVALVKGPYTPSYEVAYLRGLGPRAAVLDALAGALDFIALPSTGAA